MSFVRVARLATAASTAASMPFFNPMGLAPAATLRRPSRTIAHASTVAVVVPSPATSSVFLATSLTSSAPIFSYGSSSSISLAMETPSLVMVGAPNFFSRTTLRPFGPSVTFTALASLSTPASRARRADSSNFRIFGIWESLLLRNGGEHVAAGKDQEILAVDRDLGAPVLAVHDRVADLDAERDDLAGLLRRAAGAGSEDLARLRLLLRGVGNHAAGGSCGLGLTRTHDDAILERLELDV